MKDYSRVCTTKCHMPLCYLRVPSPPESRYSLSLLQSEDVFFGDEETAQKTASTRGESVEQSSAVDEGENQQEEKAWGSLEDDQTHEVGRMKQGNFSLLTHREFLQDTLPAEAHTCPYEYGSTATAEDTSTKDCSVLSAIVLQDVPRTRRCGGWRREPSFSPSTSAAKCEGMPEENYNLFYEDEEALATALEETLTEVIKDASAPPSSIASQIRAAQMFSCAAAQAAVPPSSQQEHQPEQHHQQSEGQEPEQQLLQDEEEELPAQVVSHSRQKISWSPDIERSVGGARQGGAGGNRIRGGGYQRQRPLRSYSMLDIENDAFTRVHENDVESEAGQCLRNMKIICGFCLLCFGVFLLLTCPQMRQSSPLIFYYILCTMLAEVGIALCFGCSICMLACLVGEQGAVYANATCGLLHRVVEGVAHYTFTGLGGYLLYNFKALEGVWYASGEEEQEKFLYLLIYVGCEATISLLYSLQTLRTLFGVCRFIVTKVYAKLTGRGDVYFLHGDAPVIYASLDQYRQALRRMRNPIDVAFLRRHPEHQGGEDHHLSIYEDSTDKEMYQV